MSDVPSWLSDDNTADVAKSLAKNKQVQSAAKSAAADPKLQKAALDHLKSQSGSHWASEHTSGNDNGNSGFASTQDVEANFGSDQPRVNPYAAQVAAIPKEEITRMTRYHNLLRLIYVGCACFMAAVSVKTFQLQTNVGLLFFAFYIFVFATLICCFEIQYFSFIANFIAVNFGFMYNIVGRWTFLLFVGFMCYTLGDLGIACMGCLYFGGVCHAVLLYKFPIFPTYQRMLHYDLHKK
jgi:hypothetical protein